MRTAASVGLISDTHGLMRPRALAALQGSDLIIHARDVGAPEIIEQLRGLAPVIALEATSTKALGHPGYQRLQSPKRVRL